ncbi:MAG: hypothetical protein ACJAZ3_001496 [Sphingobacteriales bacterium]|jgi:hypothetical protein
MKLNNSFKLLTFIFILIPLLCDAQVARKYSNAFLDIGVGARGLALSGAQTASVSDVTAGYWNPAGLTQIEDKFQASLMHAEYFGDIANYDYGAYAQKVGEKGTLGLTLIRFGVDGILNTTQLIDNQGNVNYDRIETFSAADYAFIGSYAQKLGVEGLSVGGSAKIIYRQIGDFANSYGFGLDAGVQYRKKNFLMGATLQDVTSTFNAWNFSIDEETKTSFEQTGNDLPESELEIKLPQLRVGFGYYAKVYKKLDLLAETDAIVSTDGQRNVLISAKPFSIDPVLGLEFSYSQIVFFRASLGNITRSESFEIDKLGEDEIQMQPNIGVGIKLGNLTIDYTLTDIGDQSETVVSNIFSLKYALPSSSY